MRTTDPAALPFPFPVASYEDGAVVLIDQTLLPGQLKVIELTGAELIQNILCCDPAMAGITANVRMVALTIPPTIGAAIRRITSEPVPLPSIMGNRPAIMAATVIMMGRTLISAPSWTALSMSSRRMALPACFAVS